MAKAPSVPREDLENAVAAAKLAFIQLWKTGEGGRVAFEGDRPGVY